MGLVAAGSEFLVNTATASHQYGAVMAQLTNGAIVVAWTDQSSGVGGATGDSGIGVKAQIYSASGAAVGGEFLVNTTTSGDQMAPQIVALTGGGFVVAWLDNDSSDQVYFQRFDANGAKVGAETLIHTGNQGFSFDVAALSSGGFAFSYSKLIGSNSIHTFTRAYDADGVAVSGEVMTHADIGGVDEGAQNSEIIALTGGGYVVAWMYVPDAGSDFDVHFRVYTDAGVAVSADTIANVLVAGRQNRYTIEPLTNGNFVVVWTDESGVADGSGFAVQARIFAADGTPVTGDITVNTTTLSNQLVSYGLSSDEVVALPGGGFAVGFGSMTGAKFQVISSTGSKVGSEVSFGANAGTPSVTATAAGEILVTWAEPEADGHGVRGQLFNTSGEAISQKFSVNTTTTGHQSEAVPIALDDGTFLVVFRDESATGGDTSGLALRGQFLAVTDNPAIAGIAGTTLYQEGIGGVTATVAVSPNLTLSDDDSATLASATVSISGAFQAGQDVLAFNNSSTATFGNIAASYDAGAGVLSLTSAGATATLAQWQAALRAVTYANTSDAPYTTTNRTISFQVSDGAGTSNVANQDLFVGGDDDAPTVAVSGADGERTFVEQDDQTAGSGPVQIAQAISIADPDAASTVATGTVSITSGFQAGADVLGFTANAGTMGNITGAYNATTGVLTLTSAGGTATLSQWEAAFQAVTYANSTDTPTAADRVVSFSLGGTAGTKTVHVTPGNDFPYATTVSGVTAFTEDGGPVAIEPSVTVTDPDTTLSGAQVGFENGTFVAGQDVLAFTNTSAATFGNITASFNTTTGLLSLTSAGNTATIAQWTAALRAVTYNNTSDAPNTTPREFQFYVQDTLANNTGATGVSVTVAAVNDAPVLSGAGGTTAYTEGAASAVASALTVVDGDHATLSSATVSITANFNAAEDALTFINQNGITGSYNAGTGVLTLTGSATVAQYQAALRTVAYSNSSDAPNTASRTVSFVVNDGAASSSAATQTVTVAPVNDAPSGADATLNVQAGAARAFTAADFGFTDVDGHALAAVTITTLPAAGALTLNGVAVTAGQSVSLAAIGAGQLVYAPGAVAAQNAFASFTFQVQDSGGAIDASANTVTVNVTAAPPADPGPSEPPPPPPTGTAGDDTILLDTTVRAYDGGAGNDHVTGSYMPDTLSGGDGDDSLFGGAGDDELAGGPGDNHLRGGDGRDVLTGGSGFDDLHGNVGDDTVRGGGGGDWVVGGQGQDVLFGDEGADVCLGNLGEDRIFAGEGDDVARGGQGDDSVSGGAGDDWLAGDRGSDTLSGGSGADVFHTWGDAGVDMVTDFHAAEGDRVNVLPGTEYSFAQVGADVVISMTGGGQMVLQGVQLSSLTPGWIF
ncbi:hypothetical protein ACO2Q0_14915 [Phenylobacterium sp. VNQ135]|uniref:hypothetical protein n=1 Tax=Phenylobacterium sp. VNQ135 TaxID=3400922 RepID=UPI003C0DEB5B